MQLACSSTASDRLRLPHIYIFVLSDLVPSLNLAVFRERKRAWVFSTNFMFIGKKMLRVHRVFSVSVLSSLMEVLMKKEHDNRRSFPLRLWLLLRRRFRKLQMAEC
jgi:hypothetical protein